MFKHIVFHTSAIHRTRMSRWAGVLGPRGHTKAWIWKPCWKPSCLHAAAAAPTKKAGILAKLFTAELSQTVPQPPRWKTSRRPYAALLRDGTAGQPQVALPCKHGPKADHKCWITACTRAPPHVVRMTIAR